MSLNKDASGRRSVQVDVEITGTQDEVWRAIATGPGISAWFVPTRSDERQGGQMVSDFGAGMEFPSTITSWDAPRRFVAEAAVGPPGSPTIVTAWSVTERTNGKCLVRVEHGLVSDEDDWDGQLLAMEDGWPAYFKILRIYLETYRGMPCAAMQLVGFSSEPEETTWRVAGTELGLLSLSEGQRWTAPHGFPRTSGVVDTRGRGMHPNTVILRIDAPAPGAAYVGAFSCGGMVQVYMAVYLYGNQARAAVDRDQPAWQKWMSARFPIPQMG